MMLEGRTAVVTGGSRGIGLGIAQRFLAEGARVFAISRSEGESAALKTSTGGQFTWIKADLGDEQECVGAITGILKQVDGVDVLVNNAGITRDGLVFRMSREDWDHVLTVNLTSTFLTCRAVARDMVRRRRGAIINVSSVVGLTGNAGQTNYAASKAGVIGFSKSLAREVASRGVRVNVIAPGYIDTDMTRSLGEAAREAILKMIPLGRTGSSEEVAAAAAFLASDMANYITGQVLQVDGGLAI